MAVPGLEHLPGTPLPEGSFTITDADEAALAATLGVPARTDGTAHPSWAYYATQRGIGISVAGLCELADFDVNDGPMLGGVRLACAGEIRTGVPYRVTGEIGSLERKTGRKTGVFDLMTFTERLVDPDGAEVASATNTFVLRRGAA